MAFGKEAVPSFKRNPARCFFARCEAGPPADVGSIHGGLQFLSIHPQGDAGRRRGFG
jgi:hypothetical protein